MLWPVRVALLRRRPRLQKTPGWKRRSINRNALQRPAQSGTDVPYRVPISLKGRNVPSLPRPYRSAPSRFPDHGASFLLGSQNLLPFRCLVVITGIGGLHATAALAACTKRRAIIARRSSTSFWWSFNFSYPAACRGRSCARKPKQDRPQQDWPNKTRRSNDFLRSHSLRT